VGCQKLVLWLGMYGWFFPLPGWAMSAYMNSWHWLWLSPLCCVVLPWLDACLDVHGFCMISRPRIDQLCFWVFNLVLAVSWAYVIGQCHPRSYMDRLLSCWRVGVSLAGGHMVLQVFGCVRLKLLLVWRAVGTLVLHGLAWILAFWAWCLLPQSGSLSLL
jgi:hypothetical protein